MLAPLFVAAVAMVAGSVDAAPAPKVAVQPVEQRLELELDPASRTWSGSLLATLRIADGERTFSLRLRGPVPSRVELTDGRGRVPVSWGVRGDSTLAIEASRPLAAGRGALSVAFDAPWRDAPAAAGERGPGLLRDPAHRRARLRGGAGTVFPAWPPGTPATRWSLMVHAPRAYEVRASGRRTGVDDTRGWRTWTFRVARTLDADSLRVSVRRAGAPD